MRFPHVALPWLLCCALGCGRLGFELHRGQGSGSGSNGSGSDGAGPSDGAALDGGESAGGGGDGAGGDGAGGGGLSEAGTPLAGADASAQSNDGGTPSPGSDAAMPPLDSACVAPIAPLTPAPAHRYVFDGSSGTAIPDTTGSASATAQNGAALDGSGVLNVDGSNDYVALPTNVMSGFKAVTVMLWVRWDSGPQRQSLFELGSTDAGGNVLTRLGMLVSAPGTGLTAYVETGTQSFSVSSVATLSITGLHQVAVDLDGASGHVGLYLDGKYLAQHLGTPVPLSDITVSQASLGRPLAGTDTFFRGGYGEARFYDHALGPCGVAHAFDAGPDSIAFARCAPPEPDCVFDSSRVLWTCPTPHDWTTARDLCAAAGMSLVRIDDSTQNSAVGQATGASVWMGLNDLTSEGTYAWCGGGVASYLPWGTGEPAATASESCVLRDGSTGTWADAACSEAHAYVCEP